MGPCVLAHHNEKLPFRDYEQMLHPSASAACHLRPTDPRPVQQAYGTRIEQSSGTLHGHEKERLEKPIQQPGRCETRTTARPDAVARGAP
jgi:hypothetical protein